MKTSQDPRHQHRVQAIKELFATSFLADQPLNPLTQKIVSHLTELDTHIAKAAPTWPLTKVAKVDLAILRLATYELLVHKKEPTKVIIDEAVELAKEFGSETSSGFVNGVLGTIVKTEGSQPTAQNSL